VGNIGRLYASYLANSPSPPPVTLVVHREELLHQWHAGEGIQIRRPDGRMLVDKKAFDVEYWTSSPPSSSSSGQARELVPGSICNLIVATKASAALSEADRLRRYLDARSVVGFAQNGMSRLWPPHGPAYIAHRYASADAAPREHPSFVGCLTSHGIFSLGPFSSQHAGIADAKVGLVLPGGGRPGASEAAARAADYFMRTIAGATLLDSEYITPADLWVRQLEKLHINSVINTLSAILRVKNGLLFTGPGSDQLARLMEQMTAETSCVFRALVAHPSTADILLSSSSTSSPTAGEDAAERLATARRALDERFAEAPLRRILWTVSEKVAENTSSMLQDVRAGRQTEVREFNGWLVDTARSLREGVSTTSSNNDRHHLDTSTHETLVSLVESGVVRTPEDLARELLTK
jgi:2-dehydropantoate 2-reductase